MGSIDGRVKALVDGGAIDLADLTRAPWSARRFLEQGGLDAAIERLHPDSPIESIEGARFEPPVPSPRAVWAIGLNYRDHAAESGLEPPPVPVVFTKSPGSLVGHEADIVVPSQVRQPDYEGEVAVVIGRRTRDVDVTDALDHVAGVTIANDVSARDHQFVTSQWSWSKSFDTFCPLGPVMVTLDEIDVTALALDTTLNGAIVQSSTTAELIYPVAELVAHLSQGCTLEPGDVILTGTPSGVGMSRDPQRWLQHDDVVEISVDGIGTLRNTVVRT